MSLVEVKETIAEMSGDERLEIAALIAHLNRADDPEYQAEMDRRMSAVDAGRKTSASAVENLHKDLLKEGRWPHLTIFETRGFDRRFSSVGAESL